MSRNTLVDDMTKFRAKQDLVRITMRAFSDMMVAQKSVQDWSS